MAIGFRGVNSHSTNAETSSPHDITLAQVPDLANNDLILVAIQSQANITGIDSVPTGFSTRVAGVASSTVNSGCKLWVFSKKAASEPSSGYTFSMTGSGVFAAGIVAYSGVSTSTGVIAVASTFVATASTAIIAPAVDNPTTSTGMTLVTFHGSNSACTSCTVSFTPSTGMTERFDSNQSDDGTTLRAGLLIADLIGTVSTSATATKTAIVANNGTAATASVLLRPAAAVAGTTGYIEPKNRMRRTLQPLKRASIR